VTYPEPLYTGDSERSVTFRPGRDETLPTLVEMSDEEREAFFVRHDTYRL
jgi:hypothetical protein